MFVDLKFFVLTVFWARKGGIWSPKLTFFIKIWPSERVFSTISAFRVKKAFLGIFRCSRVFQGVIWHYFFNRFPFFERIFSLKGLYNMTSKIDIFGINVAFRGWWVWPFSSQKKLFSGHIDDCLGPVWGWFAHRETARFAQLFLATNLKFYYRSHISSF